MNGHGTIGHGTNRLGAVAPEAYVRSSARGLTGHSPHRLALSGALLTLAMVLTGCGSASTPPDPLRVAQPLSDDVDVVSSVRVDDIAPDDAPPPLDPAQIPGSPGTVGSSAGTSDEAGAPTAKAEPRTVRPAPTATLDPDPEKHSATASGELPAKFDVPDGMEILPQASKLDGQQSVLVLLSPTSWQDTAAELRVELERAGWTCFSCLPFTGRPGVKGTENWRYLLNMEKDGQRLAAVISERDGGSQVDLNFAAGN